MEKRNKQIKELRKKGLTYKKIGQRFNITTERIRQIIFFNNKKVKNNLKKILQEVEEKYQKKFNDKLSQKEFIEDIILFSKKSNKQKDVIGRQILTRYLYDELKISFVKIGILLQRNHSTIIHLYYKNNK